MPKRAPRKHERHHGLPQMIVELSAMPQFGGKACSTTMAYKLCNGEVVSARLERVMREAQRRLRMPERAA